MQDRCEILVSFALYQYIRRFAFSINDGTREVLWVMKNFLPFYYLHDNQSIN